MKPDIVIIGSGIGGATIASALAPSGRRIVILERGEFLRPSLKDRDAEAIFRDGIFRPDEKWLNGNDKQFEPGNYYNVGGNSKFYGAVLLRYRAQDFGQVEHNEGKTPGWPIGYEDLETYYQAAETLFQVRGSLHGDPTEPGHSGLYPYEPVPHEPDIDDLRKRFSSIGLNPSPLPLGVDIERWLSAGQTTWDAFPDTCGGKMDAETCALKSALEYENVEIKTGCRVTQLLCDAEGSITSVKYEQEGQTKEMPSPMVILAAGAVQTAALLLASANDNCPTGLANRSDQVGRNFMNHNCSAVIAFNPFRLNRSVYQKTLMINDFYLAGKEGQPPLGNIQMLGKITGPILAANSKLPNWLANFVAARSFDFYAMSEDLPSPDSRVTLKNGQIKLHWKRSNWKTHEQLVQRLKSSLRQIGFPLVMSKPFDRRTPSHQCGTARMGVDPNDSVVTPFGRSHDHPNLYIADASVLPTSAAVNPALTIAALALRTGQHILDTEFAA